MKTKNGKKSGQLTSRWGLVVNCPGSFPNSKCARRPARRSRDQNTPCQTLRQGNQRQRNETREPGFNSPAVHSPAHFRPVGVAESVRAVAQNCILLYR